MDARQRISLSKAAKGFATDEAAQKLADVRSTEGEGIGRCVTFTASPARSGLSAVLKEVKPKAM
jgi:hypothetical protein